MEHTEEVQDEDHFMEDAIDSIWSWVIFLCVAVSPIPAPVAQTGIAG